MRAPFKLIFVVAGLVCFGLASFAPWEPYRLRVVSAGLFFVTLSTLVS